MSSQKRKSERLACFLNFILPGAGLLYLGKARWAAANLCIVLLIGVVLGLSLPEAVFDAYIHYVAFGIAGGCGAVGSIVARQMNQSKD
jgi:TM2 domain-containing membrane protein YozV